MVLGNSCQIQPYAIITPGSRLQDNAVVQPLSSKPAAAAGKLRSKTAVPSEALEAALSLVIDSRDLSETATLTLQVCQICHIPRRTLSMQILQL